MNGDTPNEGRLEVYHSNQWGTVCHHGWNLSAASVVCRQLGYPLAIDAPSNSYQFGRGTGTIWMDNVQCTGNEAHLGDCSFDGWEVNSCSHYEDAGVICANGMQS